MKRKIFITLILTILSVLMLGALSVSAETYGDLTYTAFGGKVTIIDCSSSVTSVIIPSEIVGKPVTVIGSDAFRDCTGLTSVTIPDSVTIIGPSAFRDCTGLTSVTIPDSVTTIGDYAFRGCTGLTSITIPDSVTTIGDYAFYNCTGLTKVNISSIEAWCNISFEGSYSNPLYYAGNLYLDDNKVTDLVIPDGVATIKESAFEGCTGLTSVTIPDSVTTIGESVFYGCTGLTKVNISSVDAWCNISFGDYYSNPLCYAKKLYLNGNLVTDLVIPDSVTTIGNYAFDNCTGLTSITIPDGVTKIGDYAFRGCTVITSITIPDSVTTIGDYAFRGCTGLTSVTIPDGVTTIGDYAFYNCTGLKYVYYIGTNDEWKNISIGTYNDCLKRSNIYCISILNNGVTITDCSTVATEIEIPAAIEGKTVIEIGVSAFSDCNSLTSISIPDSVTIIESSTFENCKGLTFITIPDSVTTIGESAFYGCTGLTSVTIPDSVTTIGESAFYGCTGLTSVVIPDSVTTIGSYAFYNCTGLTSVTIPDSVTTIGIYAFYGCTGLTSVIIPDSVATIGGYAFYGCTGLTSVTIPDSVTTIGIYAFYNCTGLTSITIPDSVTTIEYYAFSNCTGLTRITIPESVTTIGNSAFYGCTSLEEITLPFIGTKRGNSGAVDSVFGYIFGYSTSSSNTKDVKQYYTSTGYAYYHIPESLKKVTITDESFVGYGAFYGCTTISDIIIKSDIKAISSRAFAYHYNLLNVTIKSSSPKFADSMVFYETDFATVYGYPDSTVEEYAKKNSIEFEPLILTGHCEINGSIKSVDNTLVVNVELNAMVTDERLHIALYSENGQLVDYIIVPSDKPFDSMNVVFKNILNPAYAKIFLWSGAASMKPIVGTKIIYITQTQLSAD